MVVKQVVYDSDRKDKKNVVLAGELGWDDGLSDVFSRLLGMNDLELLFHRHTRYLEEESLGLGKKIQDAMYESVRALTGLPRENIQLGEFSFHPYFNNEGLSAEEARRADDMRINIYLMPTGSVEGSTWMLGYSFSGEGLSVEQIRKAQFDMVIGRMRDSKASPIEISGGRVLGYGSETTEYPSTVEVKRIDSEHRASVRICKFYDEVQSSLKDLLREPRFDGVQVIDL